MQLLALLVLPDRRAVALEGDVVRALVRNALDAIRAAAPGAPILFVTGGPPRSEYAAPDVTMAAWPVLHPATPLVPPPPGLRDRLAAQARNQTPPPEAALLVHALHPGLSGDLLRRALDVFAAKKSSPLVGVSPWRDHPCQFQRLVRLADMDMLYLLDPSPPGDLLPPGIGAVAVTFPVEVDYNWRQCIRSEAGRLASCRTGRPVDGLEDGQALLPAEGPNYRLVFARSPALDELPAQAGLEAGRLGCRGLFGHYRRSAALYADREDGGHVLVLDAALAHEGSVRLSLLPCGPGVTHWERLTTVEASILPGRTALAVPMPALPEGATSCVVSFLEDDAAGEFDFSIPCLPPEAPWGVVKDRLVNLATKRPITGRQAFPDVVRPDGPFAVLPLPLSETDAAGLDGARAFVCREDEGIRVCDRFDHLRHLAWSETGRETP